MVAWKTFKVPPNLLRQTNARPSAPPIHNGVQLPVWMDQDLPLQQERIKFVNLIGSDVYLPVIFFGVHADYPSPTTASAPPLHPQKTRRDTPPRSARRGKPSRLLSLP